VRPSPLIVLVPRRSWRNSRQVPTTRAPITYATTVTSTSVSVSSTGAVTVTGGPIRVATYTVSGTDSDTLKDTGTWTFTLTRHAEHDHADRHHRCHVGRRRVLDHDEQLTTSGSNGGSVTFAPTSGDETDLKVTAAGLVSDAGLPQGRHVHLRRGQYRRRRRHGTGRSH